MKAPPYTPYLLALLSVFGLSLYIEAQVPVSWDVSIPASAAKSFDIYRGETVAISPRIMRDGAAYPIPTNATAYLYWSTNSFATSPWATQAVISATDTGRVTALWTPICDQGAWQYQYFIGIQESSGLLYRVRGTITMRASPGASPAITPLAVWDGWTNNLGWYQASQIADNASVVASNAQSLANSLLSTVANAQSAASNALDLASAVYSTATNAQTTATNALAQASAVYATATNAQTVATNALAQVASSATASSNYAASVASGAAATIQTNLTLGLTASSNYAASVASGAAATVQTNLTLGLTASSNYAAIVAIASAASVTNGLSSGTTLTGSVVSNGLIKSIGTVLSDVGTNAVRAAQITPALQQLVNAGNSPTNIGVLYGGLDGTGSFISLTDKTIFDGGSMALEWGVEHRNLWGYWGFETLGAGTITNAWLRNCIITNSILTGSGSNLTGITAAQVGAITNTQRALYNAGAISFGYGGSLSNDVDLRLDYVTLPGIWRSFSDGVFKKWRILFDFSSSNLVFRNYDPEGSLEQGKWILPTTTRTNTFLSTTGSGASLTGITAAQIGALSNSMVAVANAGGLTNAAAFATASQGVAATNALALAASNALPYQPWSSVLPPANNLSTSLIAFADGTLPLLVCTGAQTVGVNVGGGWGAAGINRFTLALWSGTWAITVQSNATVRWGSPITLSTTRTNHLMFRGCGTNDWVIVPVP